MPGTGLLEMRKVKVEGSIMHPSGGDPSNDWAGPGYAPLLEMVERRAQGRRSIGNDGVCVSCWMSWGSVVYVGCGCGTGWVDGKTRRRTFNDSRSTVPSSPRGKPAYFVWLLTQWHPIQRIILLLHGREWMGGWCGAKQDPLSPTRKRTNRLGSAGDGSFAGGDD